MIKQHEATEQLVRPGYEHCPLCALLVRNSDLVHHIRHSGCRLTRPRERELIAAGQSETPCPLCNRSILRTDLREHLHNEHAEDTNELGKCYRYTAG